MDRGSEQEFSQERNTDGQQAQIKRLELPYDPAIPPLGTYENKNTNSKRYMHLNIHSSIF